MVKKIREHHAFMSEFTIRLIKTFLRPASLLLGILAVGWLIVGSVLFYMFEQGRNEQVQTYFDALYFSVTIMTSVGLGDLAPATVAGKIVAMFMMIGGTGIFVSFTAVLATTLVEVEDRQLNKK